VLGVVQYVGKVHIAIVSFISKGEAPEWGCDEVWEAGKPNFNNCTAVFGVMYKLGIDEQSAYGLKELFTEAPGTVSKDFYCGV
jgi:hypothetical protein